MVRHATISKSGSLRDTIPGVQVIDQSQVHRPAKTVNIPALYMRPLGDREFQGCLKSRA